jgi:MerR family transcriptional regulator, thiopeptide resistance regulator
MYTVKQLARSAGVTARTLHYYDEIGLLPPARVGENGYRYYDEAAALRLQQILLYRRMELPLEEIKRIMGRHDFDILAALEEHRLALQKKIGQLETITRTVDETILYMKGKKQMTTNEMFTGFSEEQQAEYEKEAMQMYDPETVKASNAKWKGYGKEKQQQILIESGQIYVDMIAAMPKGAASPEAQACVERWRKNMDHFWSPSLEQLNGLGNLYNEDARFKANFEKMQPGLAEFMREAIREYVRGLLHSGD